MILPVSVLLAVNVNIIHTRHSFPSRDPVRTIHECDANHTNYDGHMQTPPKDNSDVTKVHSILPLYRYEGVKRVSEANLFNLSATV